MFHLRKWIKDFFSISYSQANGIMVLLPLITVILLSEPTWRWYISHRPIDRTDDLAALDSLIAIWNLADSSSGSNVKNGSSTTPAPAKFRFDPNTLGELGLKKAGFPEKMISRIINYRLKGGRFRVKADLLKMYGMDTAFFQRLYPFIDLPASAAANKKQWHPTPFMRKATEFQKPFDMNTADTVQLKKISGIGDKLSMRIIKYRDALGGYVAFGQLSEVYGLDSVVVDRLSKRAFVSEGFIPKKINLNTASEDVLEAHPYFSRSEARSIVAYRFQHGEFKSIDDLVELPQIKPETIIRVAPYLSLIDK